VDGHKVKVLLPGYADGAWPAKDVPVRSEAILRQCGALRLPSN
jgi:hypothetical protein